MIGLLAPRTSLACYYHFDGNSTDSSGNGNNGTDTTVTYGRANGRFNEGALFNGTTSLITANGLITTLANSTAGTIGFWAYNQERSNAQCQQLYFDGGVTTMNINFDWRTGVKRLKITCTVDGVLQWDLLTAVNSLVALADAWHHYAFVHNGTACVIYIDGVLASTAFNTTTNKTKWFKAIITDATTKATIAYPVLSTYKGKVDEMFIETSKVWTANEVAKYYSRSQGFSRQ